MEGGGVVDGGRWCCGWMEVVLWMEGGGVVDGRGMKKREK